MRTKLTIFIMLVALSTIKSQTNLNTAKIIQFGSSGNDLSQCVTSDNTGIYVGGTTDGVLGAQNFGMTDCFIRKYSLNGDTLLWTVQFGTFKEDDLAGIAVNDSGLFVVGRIGANVWPGPQPQKGDGFLKRFSKNGTLIWTDTIANPNPNKMDEVLGIVLDNNAIYVCGGTLGDIDATNYGDEDYIVARYDYKGVKIWGVQYGGIKFEEAFNIALYANKLYIIGTTGSALGIYKGQEDAFVASYDINGNYLWLKQFGTDSTEFGKSIAVNANGVHCVGYTSGHFFGASNGSNDGYTFKIDHSGNQIWINQFGTPASNLSDVNYFVSNDPTGIYATGLYKGSYKHGPNLGTEEVFIKKYAHSTSSSVIWETILNSDSLDIGTAICNDNSYVYSVGYTNGNLGSQNQGKTDAFLAIMNNTNGVISVNENLGNKLDFSIYPNPVKDNIIIKIDRELYKNIKIQIVNIYGQTVNEIENRSETEYQTLDISKLRNGIYFITIHSDKGSGVQKIIVSN